jgi:hypothetical protein
VIGKDAHRRRDAGGKCRVNRDVARVEGQRRIGAGRKGNMAEADGAIGPLGKWRVDSNRFRDVEVGRAVDVEIARKRGGDFHGSSVALRQAGGQCVITHLT